jgi:hypothetical protein
VRTNSRWSELRGEVLEPKTGAALARAEDEIDAYVCAYTALYYWAHGTSRCRIAGDADDGYIVTPVTPELAACFDRLASEVASSPRELARAQSYGSSPSAKVALNAARVNMLLPDAAVRSTPHVAELSVEGEDGIIVLVTAEAVELRLPTVEWTAGTHSPAEASRLWKRLEIDEVSDERLRSEITDARAERESEFATCRYCGQRVPAEHRISSDVCHGCASRYEGVVF